MESKQLRTTVHSEQPDQIIAPLFLSWASVLVGFLLERTQATMPHATAYKPPSISDEGSGTALPWNERSSMAKSLPATKGIGLTSEIVRVKVVPEPVVRLRVNSCQSPGVAASIGKSPTANRGTVR